MNLNTTDYYHEIINGLVNRDLEIYPLSELNISSKPAIGLRHDIDGKPGVALYMARYLAMKGVPGSFYLLHSASYYTRENIPSIVYKMNVAGCEIGLHNDAWRFGEHGPQIVKEELEYLRGLGANIKGTVAHNSLSVYGAENYEVFKEKVLLKRKNIYPLGELSMKKLGLTYEGTFTRAKPGTTILDVQKHMEINASIQSEEWMHEFLVNPPYCDYDTYAQFWLIGNDKWAIALMGELHWKVGLKKVFELVDTLPSETKSIFVIHPDYFHDTTVEDSTNPDFVFIPRPQWYALFLRVKRYIHYWTQRLRSKIIRIYLYIRERLYPYIRFIFPVSMRWKNTQKLYVEWVQEPLPEKYIREIIVLGKRFSDYVGDPMRCLDVGCGNGLYSGKTYEEIGYSYLTKSSNSYVIGLDPLPLIATLPPWLDEYKQGVAEEIPYPDNEFDKITIATSLDHVIDANKCIAECFRVLKPQGTLYIWTSYGRRLDKYHPNKYTEEEIANLLTSNGFKIIDNTQVTKNDQLFIKAQKAPNPDHQYQEDITPIEFDYQWRDIPSPALELTQDRVVDLLKVTKLPPNFFKGKQCLDVGCGSGRFTWALQQLGAKVTSIDISPEAIEKCKEINQDSYIQDIYELEPNPVYDFVLCLGVLHHLATPEIGFEKISTQVIKGGILQIMVYHQDTQEAYKEGRSLWPTLSHEERIKLCQRMLRSHKGANLHGWWDAFNPKYNWSYHPKEVKKWFQNNGFKKIKLTKRKQINMRGERK